MSQRLLFMGSPEFAARVLVDLAAHYEMTGVVTQPDRPAGRGNKLTEPAVKVTARQLGIETIQPEKLKAPDAMAWLTAKQPDAIVVAAYGQILRQAVLDLPPWGCINVHASLLPRWRGAAPIQAAILNGDEKTGVTIIKLDKGVDTGPTLSRLETPIEPEETAGMLSERLAVLGSQLLLETLAAYFTGTIFPEPQSEAGATYAGMLEKDQAQLDFGLTAIELARKVRAFNPSPVAWFDWNGQPVKVYGASVSDAVIDRQSGKHGIIGKKPAISTAEGWLLLEHLQLPGKRLIDGKSFLAGARNWTADA